MTRPPTADADEILVTLHQDGSASVFDNGRGMPVDTHPTLGISGVEVIYTKLHAGGKFNNENYSYSGGLHGVGASVVNALSKWVTVDVFRDWTHWRISFASKYDPKLGKVTAGIPQGPLEKVGNTRKKGSLVRFLPDDTIFEDTRFNSDLVARHLQEQAFLNKGLRIVFTDERGQEPRNPGTHFPLRGRRWWTLSNTWTRTKMCSTSSPFIWKASGRTSFSRLPSSTPTAIRKTSFPTPTTFPPARAAAMRRASRPPSPRRSTIIARRIGALKEKDDNLSGEDFREGLTCRDDRHGEKSAV